MTTDPPIQPPFHVPPLPPVSSLSWFASISLLDGWGYGFSFFLFKFFFFFMTMQWCILTVACIEAVHAIAHPQLSVSLSLTLNHSTRILWKGGRENSAAASPLLAHPAESANLSFSLVITLIGPHVSVCHSAVTYCCSVWMLSQEGRELIPETMLWSRRGRCVVRRGNNFVWFHPTDRRFD